MTWSRNARVMVTGAASGIGAAIAHDAIASGARVAALDRNSAGLDALKRSDERTITMEVDLRDASKTVAAVHAAVGELGGLDTVVTAAGVDLERTIDGTDVSAWNEVLAINLTAPFVVVRAAVDALRASGRGTVALIASGAGLRPLAGRAAYCTSKAGLVMLAKALALELASDGIRVNAVCPGAIDTPLLRASFSHDGDHAADRARVAARYPLGSIGTTADIVAAVRYLCGTEASYVTGIALPVDGGRTLH